MTAIAGTAATAYAVGSAGERTRFVVVADGVAAPSGGPDTGLGGLSGDEGAPWLAALLAALAAGALGGVLYTRAPRRPCPRLTLPRAAAAWGWRWPSCCPR